MSKVAVKLLVARPQVVDGVVVAQQPGDVIEVAPEVAARMLSAGSAEKVEQPAAPVARREYPRRKQTRRAKTTKGGGDDSADRG